jgi:hypothetical protein
MSWPCQLFCASHLVAGFNSCILHAMANTPGDTLAAETPEEVRLGALLGGTPGNFKMAMENAQFH